MIFRVRRAPIIQNRVQIDYGRNGPYPLYYVHDGRLFNFVNWTLLRKEAKILALSLIHKGEHKAHAYHTIIKVDLAELADLIEKKAPADIERKIKELGESIARIVQIFPDDSYIRDAEATFCDLISKHSQALIALKKAFNANKRSPYIASRLSKVHEQSGDLEEAVRILESCLEANPSQKNISFQLAMLLMKLPKDNSAEIRHHLRRSFTLGDSNYAAQYWYARLLYIEGSIKDARNIFKDLREANIDTEIKKKPRGVVTENGKAKRFRGTISSLEASYAFITRDDIKDVIFTHLFFSTRTDWEKLSSHKRVTFSLAFNYRGPVALEVKEE